MHRWRSDDPRLAYYRWLADSWPPEAVSARRVYDERLDEIVAAGAAERASQVELEVLSFACERDLPEQVASVRSFLANVGVPTAFTIVSDGSHSQRSRELLEGLHSRVEVVDWQSVSRPGLPQALWDYGESNWRGKKLLVLASLPVERPLFYTDADVLFFAGATELQDLPAQSEDGPRFLPDCDAEGPFLDVSMLTDHEEEELDSINAGVIYIPKPLDWTPALVRLVRRLRSGRATFTGQTVVHLALHDSGARPFDRSRYVVAVDDRSLDEDPYVRHETVLRHYVAPVRHKFWTTLSRSPATGLRPR
jgi:hypothetical protein